MPSGSCEFCFKYSTAEEGMQMEISQVPSMESEALTFRKDISKGFVVQVNLAVWVAPSCDGKRYQEPNKAVMMNVPDFGKSSYQRNTIGGICVRSHTIPIIQEFYCVPVFHPRRHRAKSDVQAVIQKVERVEH
jgi:hypothetical protein